MLAFVSKELSLGLSVAEILEVRIFQSIKLKLILREFRSNVCSKRK